MGTLRDPPKPPEEGLLKPLGRPTLGRDAPTPEPPKLREREGPALGRATLERPKLPRRDDAELARPTLGRPALGLRTLLVRLGPVLGLPYEPVPDAVDAGRRTLLVGAGFTRGWLTTVPVGRDLGTVLVNEGPPPARPTLPVRVAATWGRPTTVVVVGARRERLAVSTRLALCRVRLTPAVRVADGRWITRV